MDLVEKIGIMNSIMEGIRGWFACVLNPYYCAMDIYIVLIILTLMTINMKDMACVKYKDFLFDYSALDVDRLKGMFGL